MKNSAEEEVTEDTTEVDLLHRAKLGDFSAFQALIEKLQPRVYGLTFRILQQAQDAEDATQQTFVALIEHIHDFREQSSIATWVLRIATNNALKILRKQRGLRMVSMSEPNNNNDSYADIPHPDFIAPWSKTADEIVQQAEVQAELETALNELDEKYRLVFVLRDIQGQSVRETAEALQITEGNVKVRLLRARLALRERLTQKFGDPNQVMVSDHKH